VVRITVSNYVRSLEFRAEMRGVQACQIAGIFPRHVRIISIACADAYAFCCSAIVDFPGVAEVFFSKRPACLIPVYVSNDRHRFQPMLRGHRN